MSPLKTILVTLFCVFILTHSFAQTGKDGSLTVTTTGVILNRYDVLAASASAGATSITVTDINNLAGGAVGVNNPYATSALSYGDLIMIIKMQGATITSTNDATYGSISNYNGTGTYELAWVESVSGNVITLASALSNAFTVGSTNRVQVIRIPRLNSLTVNSGASITASAWSSSYKGGVIALEVNGNAVINGSINANGLGFRGGQSIDHDNFTGTYAGFVSTANADGSEKGESIAGYQADYDALGGRYARGAPANGGGGGDFHNTGGGGGANAGVVASWTGTGVPDVSVSSWVTAWNLEAAGFSSSASSGGGRGGYSYSSANRDALSLAPGTSSGQTWGGDLRRIVGGLGGRPLTYSANNLFMGGGGGGGDQNQSSGTSGANGGGIICLTVTGTLSGTGSITANGATASNSFNQHKDGLGGGGGGGAIRLNVQGTIGGISLYANGGNGGSQVYTILDTEAEGPGGGGGAGYIAVTGSPSITISSVGGSNGTTNSSGLTEFLPNGATKGGVGFSATIAFAASPSSPSWSVLPVNICINTITQSGQTKVQWTGYSEAIIKSYELQGSQNAMDWGTILVQLPISNSNNADYDIPLSVTSNLTYVRLKTTSKSGQVFYSCVRSVNDNRAQKWTLTQNETTLFVYFAERPDLVRVIDANGRSMDRGLVKTNGTNVVVDKSRLPNGLYFIHLINRQDKKVFRFVK
jgi:hypothetical protein